MNHRAISKLIVALCALCVVAVFMIQPLAIAQDTSSVRVYLRRLKIEDSMRIQFQGNYMLEGGQMTFTDGTQIDVTLNEGKLVLHAQGISLVMGEKMKLLRCEGEKDAYLLLNGNTGMYEGDLALDIFEGCIRPILTIHLEDYLLGVVPFEMGDSFPLEALKAQAIAARTYVVNKHDASQPYDVEDTTNDQAYKGRTTNSPLSEEAVVATTGIVGTYRGKVAQCYYSASNGGQTELGQHVWPLEDPSSYDYMDMRDDPYDYENEASSVKRYTLKKKPGKEGVGAALHTEIVSALSKPLEELGFTAKDDLVRIDEILKLELMNPKYAEPSRLMTTMKMELKISLREYTNLPSQTHELTAIQTTLEPGATPAPTFTPAPTATPEYSPYKKLKQTFVIEMPIFPTMEKAMGLSINVYQNELFSVSDIGSSYMIESRRYGHGVGMSQRGAQQMANKYAMTFEEILAFYYPGLEFAQLDVKREPLPTIDYAKMATPAPTPSPTPRPTLMPVTDSNLPRGAYVAIVTNIDDDSSLNLRQGPSLSSEILRRLYKNQRLIVLSTDKNGWSHVKTDVIEGYVKAEYLQTAK